MSTRWSDIHFCFFVGWYIYRYFDTQRHCSTPSTPAHLFTCAPVHLLLSLLSYHHIMMRWCVAVISSYRDALICLFIWGCVIHSSDIHLTFTASPSLLRLSLAITWRVFTSLVHYKCNVVNKSPERLCEAFWFATGMLTLGGLKDDYSVLSPLTGLGGRNGGLGLKCR